MDPSKLLQRDEIRDVLADLHGAIGKKNTRINLMIFRLSCCLGLRRVEIAGLNVGDVLLGGARPVVHVRKEITKGKDGVRHDRNVPLWWDKGTFEDVKSWIKFLDMPPSHPLVCSLTKGSMGLRLTKQQIQRRWRTAIGVLGPDRVSQLAIHCGRRSFASHAIAGGRSVAEVKYAMGHANLSSTSVYVGALETGASDIFDFKGE